MSDVAHLSSEIPPTWAITTLGTVADYGKICKAEPTEMQASDWILELEDIEKDSSRLLQRVTFGERQSKSTKSRFEKGDVLYGKLRPYLNKVLIADQPGFCTTEIIPIKSGKYLDSRYLFYWLKHPAFLAYVEAESHGMNMPRLGTDTGRAAPFVLAPHSEQTRIADQLDTLLARINACNDRLDAIPGILKRFRQRVYMAATLGTLTEDWRAAGSVNDWVHERATDVCAKVQSGGTPKEGFSTHGVPFLKVYNLVNQKVDFDYKPQYIKSSIHHGSMAKSRTQPGDVLMNIVGPPLGKVAMVPADRQEWNINQAITLFRPSDRISSGWLYCILCSGVNITDIIHETRGSAGQTNISLSQCRDFIFPVPSIAEQIEIVRRVEQLLELADRIEARFTAIRAHAQRLSPRLLAKAFRGELVQQDPQDEPASVLLQRIAAVQPAKAKVPRGRPRSQTKELPLLQPLAPRDGSVLPDGAWAAPADPEGFDVVALLTAVLKAWDTPMPQAQARLAALLCQQPRLLTAVLPTDKAAQWCRLVGDAAKPLPAQVTRFQPTTNSHWRRALVGMRARGDVLEAGTGPEATWALGPAAAQVETAGWPDGRAGWVVAYLQAYGVEAVLPKLEPMAREFVDVKAA